MTDAPENPRERIGGNFPPLGKQIAGEQEDFAGVAVAYLREEYGAHPGIVDALLAECAALMKDAAGQVREIADDDMKGKVATLIKRLRDEAKALEAIRSKEKTPYLRGGQGVDQFFFGLIDKLLRRERAGRPGAADILADRLTAYDTRKLMEEQARRRREAEEAARIAREAQEKAARDAAAAEEARLAAERARKPEAAAAKAAVAEVREEAAVEAQAKAAVAEAEAHAAHVSTLARPADLMRRRGDDGTLSTMATEPYAEVEDEAKLDRNVLWPFIGLDAKEKALRAWARTTGHSTQMAGARIGKRPKSVVR